MADFPDTLKSWRKVRRFSQLELANEANVSARHLAFLETGRARPSVTMIGRLGDALSLPLAARNQLLTAAGFAVRYPNRPWSDAAMVPVQTAVDHLLDRHAPYPALAVDQLWQVVSINGPARMLFGILGVGPGSSLLDLMRSDSLPPLIENWDEVAMHAAQRLRTESAAQGGVAELDRTAHELMAKCGHHRGEIGPVVPTIFRFGDVRLSLFAVLAQFGTPEDVTLDHLKIELYFPSDPATHDALAQLAAGPGH